MGKRKTSQSQKPKTAEPESISQEFLEGIRAGEKAGERAACSYTPEISSHRERDESPFPRLISQDKRINLVIRAEPSFNFIFTGEKDEQSLEEMTKQNVPGSIDVSLYSEDRLILSPHDFYKLGKYEQNVKRDFSNAAAAGHLKTPFLTVLNRFSDLELVILIENADMHDRMKKIHAPHLRLVEQRGDVKRDDLLVLGRNSIGAVYDTYWARTYPRDVWTDRSDGNDFTAYLMEQSGFAEVSEEARRLIGEQNAKATLDNISKIRIRNLSYGFRIRIEGAPEDFTL